MVWRDRLAGLLPAPAELPEVALLALLAPLVVAPPPLEALAARVLVRWQFRPGGWVRERRLAKFPAAMAEGGRSPLDVAQAGELESMRERIRVLRGALFPWYRRRISIGGLSQVRMALTGGNGAILWVHRCVESNVAVKQAMWAAGLPLAHLSRPGHPFSNRPFGRRWVNPLLRRPEVRFLAERVVIDSGNEVAPLRRLLALLRENRVVSVTVTFQASRVERFPLLGGHFLLPHGPVQLAASSGAPLLPVFTYRAGGRTHVEIGPPLHVAGRDGESVRAALRESCRWLEARVLAHPEAWIAWRGAQFAPPGGTFDGAAAPFDSGE